LADYNAGRLRGRWIDANQPADAIREEVAQMLAESKESIAEDYAIHDYEYFGDLELSECTGIDQVAEAAYR
jgi:antirestriction protein